MTGRQYTVYTDGASRGNPGQAGVAFIITDDSVNHSTGWYRYLGRATNNQAEYTALASALQHLQSRQSGMLKLYSDSELMVRQVNGFYRVKNPQLLELFNQVKKLLAGFPQWTLTHIPRLANGGADALANRAIDERNTKLRSIAVPEKEELPEG